MTRIGIAIVIGGFLILGTHNARFRCKAPEPKHKVGTQKVALVLRWNRKLGDPIRNDDVYLQEL